MASAFELRPAESVLFQGDVTLLKSKLNVEQTAAVVTSQRLLVGDRQAIDRSEIATVSEEKHGLAKKMVFSLRDGSSVAMSAANQPALRAASLILTGQADPGSMPKAPKLSEVRNGTAWLAALGPLLAGAVALVLSMLFWSPEQVGARQVIMMLITRVVLTYLFLRIDHLSLQKQGYDVKALGLADPITFPVYLFSRARVFGQSKAPAVVWCVIVVLDILATVAA